MGVKESKDPMTETDRMFSDEKTVGEWAPCKPIAKIGYGLEFPCIQLFNRCSVF